MAIDYSKVVEKNVNNHSEFFRGGTYYDEHGHKLSKWAVRKYLEYKNGVNRRPVLEKKYQKLFPKGSFKDERGHLASWVKPLAVRKDPNSRPAAKSKWVTHKGNVTAKMSAGMVLKGTADWVRQLDFTAHQIPICAENFRIAMGYRALKVFSSSFGRKRFHTSGSSPWKPLAPYTIRKRRKRGTLGGGVLVEYGDLRDSLAVEERSAKAGIVSTKVYTKKVPANAGKHKKHTLCYAYWHNEGKGTYGNTGENYIKRQFMGHSSYLDAYKQANIRQMMRTYLFDNVFQYLKK